MNSCIIKIMFNKIIYLNFVFLDELSNQVENIFIKVNLLKK